MESFPNSFAVDSDNNGTKSYAGISSVGSFEWVTKRVLVFANLLLLITTFTAIILAICLLFGREATITAKTEEPKSVGDKPPEVEPKSCETSWERFKDEKCFKLLKSKGHQSYQDAANLCREENEKATLVTILGEDEQGFLYNYLFEKLRIFDSIWLGAKLKRLDAHGKDPVRLEWADESPAGYTNWMEGHPVEEEKVRACLEMQSSFGFTSGATEESNQTKTRRTSTGKWMDVPCQKKNLVVCQVMQNLSVTRLQKILFNTNHELRETKRALADLMKKQTMALDNKIDGIKAANVKLSQQFKDDAHTLESTLRKEMETVGNITKQTKQFALNQGQFFTHRLNEVRRKVQNVENVSIPIGFIYIEISGQKRPQELWPNYQWTDISYLYSGLFFRVSGGNSSAFGTIQEENSPRLREINSVYNSWDVSETSAAILANDMRSKKFVTGRSYSGGYYSLQFTVSSGEVRPRNQAIHVWKRTV